MNKTVRIIIIVAVLLVIALIVARKKGWIGKEESTEVETERTFRTEIVEIVSASGKIQPELEVKISPEVSGEIIELPIIEGDAVEKGQLLVRINPDIYQAAVSRTEASVNASKAGVAQSKAQLIEFEKIHKRNESLFKKGAISQQEFDASLRGFQVAELTVESAEFQLKSAQANLKEARDNLNRTTIYSPNHGTVSMLNVEQGERVVGTAQMAGTELLRVADLSQMEVLVEVNENDIVRVEMNDTALIEVDAFLGEKFIGVVTQIANSANLSATGVDQVTNFEVKVRILPESYKHLLGKNKSVSPLRPGMTASVEIQTERRRNILVAPIQSVTLRSDTSSAQLSARERRELAKESGKDEEYEVVFVVEDGKTNIRVVKTGIQDDKYIQILRGLKDGDEVVTGPYSAVSKTLRAGEKVQTKENSDSSKRGEENSDTESEE
jgi:HlyD family secretion protein